ncbi:MAG: hypothetical protein MMC33_007457 [Icmadophila ericetorum]|nr:hypothetical protein [Icmadophila ericetorum]
MTTSPSLPRRTITKTKKRKTTTTTTTCTHGPSETHTLPNLRPCQSGVQTFAIQGRGCNNPLHGKYVGTAYQDADTNYLVVNPLMNGSTNTPTLFYLDISGTMRAVPETTANATAIEDTPVIFFCDEIDPGGFAGSLAFNTSAAWAYNLNPNNYNYIFSLVKCHVDATTGRLYCHDVYCRHKLFFGRTKTQMDASFGLWYGYVELGPPTTYIQNVTYYAVPGCTM